MSGGFFSLDTRELLHRLRCLPSSMGCNSNEMDVMGDCVGILCGVFKGSMSSDTRVAEVTCDGRVLVTHPLCVEHRHTLQ